MKLIKIFSLIFVALLVYVLLAENYYPYYKKWENGTMVSCTLLPDVNDEFDYSYQDCLLFYDFCRYLNGQIVIYAELLTYFPELPNLSAAGTYLSCQNAISVWNSVADDDYGIFKEYDVYNDYDYVPVMTFEELEDVSFYNGVDIYTTAFIAKAINEKSDYSAFFIDYTASDIENPLYYPSTVMYLNALPNNTDAFKWLIKLIQI